MTNLLQVAKSGLFSTILKTCTLLRAQSILDIPVASYVSSAKIYENLKIPQPPKKPVNAFFRFAKDRLDGKQLTIEDRRNAFKSLSAEWKQMDESTRAQLYPDCKIALAQYKNARADWAERLTKEQKEQIADARKTAHEVKYQREEKRQRIADCIALNKPKFPDNAIILFRNKSGISGTIPDLAQKWHKLSPSEQQQYRDKASELRGQYVKLLDKWEEKMIQKGRFDLVRKKTIKAIETAEKPKKNEKPK